MKTILSIILAVALGIMGCDDTGTNPPNESFCNVNSVEDLRWLREEIESKDYSKPSTVWDVMVYHAYYQNKEVIYISICCPLCSVMPPEIKTCDGVVLGRLYTDIDRNKLVDEKVIWRTHNQICP